MLNKEDLSITSSDVFIWWSFVLDNDDIECIRVSPRENAWIRTAIEIVSCSSSEKSPAVNKKKCIHARFLIQKEKALRVTTFTESVYPHYISIMFSYTDLLLRTHLWSYKSWINVGNLFWLFSAAFTDLSSIKMKLASEI